MTQFTPFTVSLALALSLLFAGPAGAARMYLDNGEAISGTLLGVSGGRVDWQSAILGELSVDQGHVQFIETDDEFDLRMSGRTLNNCWMYRDHGHQLLHCDQGVERLFDWKLVQAAGTPVSEPRPLLVQRGDVKVMIEDSNGNTNLEKYDLDGNLELRYAETRHTLRLRYVEENANGNTTQDRWRGSYRYDQFLTEQWFLAGNAFYEEDEFKDLDSRTSVGLGGGFQFIETDFVDLVATVTGNYVDEQFAEGEGRHTPALLWNLDFRWRFNERGVELFHRHAALQSLDSTRDYELESASGFRYPINGHFSSVLQFEYSYDNTPADEAGKTDRKLSVGMDYHW